MESPYCGPQILAATSSGCLLRGAKEARKFAERAWCNKAKFVAA